LASLTGQAVPPEIPDLRRVRDTLVRSQTTVDTYARVCEYVNRITGTRIFIQYQPQLPGLSPFKLTIIPDDRETLSRDEILQVVQPFYKYRFLTLEIALDFDLESGVDLSFVRRHGVFGKSRPNTSRLFVFSAQYGDRKGDKLVRCYRKLELNVFRVELELHSALLRRNRIAHLADFWRLSDLLFPNHIRFVRINWAALTKHLSRRGLDATQIIQRAKSENGSLHATMEFLRTNVGVYNVHRFLRTTSPSSNICKGLKSWSRRF
jgi:hypothetical protein